MFKDLKKSDYLKLIKNQKKILFSDYSNFFTHCISSLYTNRSTFDFKKNYNHSYLSFILNFVLFFKQSLIFVFKLISNRSIIYKQVKNLNNKKNIFIISNVINKNIDTDIYFGNLEQKIKKKDFNCIKIFKNFSFFDELTLWKNLSNKNNKIILPRNSNFITEVYFIYLSLKEYVRLKFLITIKKIKIDSTHTNLISLRNVLTILPTLRLCHEIKKLILAHSPKIIIFTFEGHSWERALIKTIKDIDKNIKVVGYQFSAITQLHYSILSNFKKNYSPDIIANSGESTKNIFKKIYKNKTQCKVLGSSKYKDIKTNVKMNTQILICPENLPNQLTSMLSLAIQLSTMYKKIKFRFRFHPGVSLNIRLNYLKQLKKIPSNLIISSDSLHKDLIRCTHIIYRGTATVIESLNYGVTPIYLNTFNKELDENPLFFNKRLFFTLNNVSDLDYIIKRKKNLTLYSNAASKYFSKFKLNFFNLI